MSITRLRRVRYTGPDIPPGREDYAIFFQVCREMTGWFGHVTALAPRFSPGTVDFGNCQTYSVSFAMVEACETGNLNMHVSAGDDLASGGPVIDMGMVDQRITVAGSRRIGVRFGPRSDDRGDGFDRPRVAVDALHHQLLAGSLVDPSDRFLHTRRGPAGLELDYDAIRAAKPAIAATLR